MKSFEEFQEALSMKDLKQIKGGTDAQRKIAQDRQKAREAKNKGFDPKKPVANDAPTKEPGGALAKRPSSAVRKPDLRKSQIGKWSQGIKNSPGKLAKKAGSSLAKKAGSAITKRDDIEHVDVKDLGPNKDDKQAGNRPGTTKNKNKDVKKTGGKKGKGFLGKAIKKVGKTAMQGLKDVGGSGDVTTSGDLEGLSGRNKGLIG